MTYLDFLIKYRKTPWERGQHDCLMFLHKYLDEVYSFELFDKSKFKFHDLKTAKRAYIKGLKAYGVSSINEHLDKCLKTTIAPMNGDIVAKPDVEGLVGYSYGVVHNNHGHFVDSDGIISIPLDQTIDLYWRVS